MCQPTDAPPYPRRAVMAAETAPARPGATALCRHCLRPVGWLHDPACRLSIDPTAAEDARINARTPRDDRNEPEA